MIVVCGLVNLETTLSVDAFPLTYEPVRFPFFGVHSRVAGVGFNLAKALTTLGSPVRLLSLMGQDDAGKLARQAVRRLGLAVLFAGYKIGTSGGAEGFLSEAELERLYRRLVRSPTTLRQDSG